MALYDLSVASTGQQACRNSRGGSKAAVVPACEGEKDSCLWNGKKISMVFENRFETIFRNRVL